jgi:hypothetical protein
LAHQQHIAELPNRRIIFRTKRKIQPFITTVPTGCLNYSYLGGKSNSDFSYEPINTIHLSGFGCPCLSLQQISNSGPRAR